MGCSLFVRYELRRGIGHSKRDGAGTGIMVFRSENERNSGGHL